MDVDDEVQVITEPSASTVAAVEKTAAKGVKFLMTHNKVLLATPFGPLQVTKLPVRPRTR